MKIDKSFKLFIRTPSTGAYGKQANIHVIYGNPDTYYNISSKKITHYTVVWAADWRSRNPLSSYNRKYAAAVALTEDFNGFLDKAIGTHDGRSKACRELKEREEILKVYSMEKLIRTSIGG